MVGGLTIATGGTIIGLGAMIAAGIEAYKNGEDIGNAMENAWKDIKTTGKGLYNYLENRVNFELKDNGKGIYNYLKNGVNVEPKDNGKGNEQQTPPTMPKPTNGKGGIIGAASAIQSKIEQQQEITDTTGQNTDIPIGNQFEDYIKAMQDLQRAEWERADQIRAETQQREDTAWQRSVRDMVKAGINPNLVNATPAESGGGIIATGNTTAEGLTTQITETVGLLEQLIEQNFEGNQNAKDRAIKAISSLAMLMMVLGRG